MSDIFISCIFQSVLVFCLSTCYCFNFCIKLCILKWKRVLTELLTKILSECPAKCTLSTTMLWMDHFLTQIDILCCTSWILQQTLSASTSCIYYNRSPYVYNKHSNMLFTRTILPSQECNIIATEKLLNAAPLWIQLGVPHRALWGRRKWLLPRPCRLRWSRCLAGWMLGCCQHNEFEHLDLHRTYRQYRVMWIQMVMHWKLGWMDLV